jgi:hypothetical protein
MNNFALLSVFGSGQKLWSLEIYQCNFSECAGISLQEYEESVFHSGVLHAVLYVIRFTIMQSNVTISLFILSQHVSVLQETMEKQQEIE